MSLKEIIKTMMQKYACSETIVDGKKNYTFQKPAKCALERMWAEQGRKFKVMERVFVEYA
jgi:hypothetical protein